MEWEGGALTGWGWLHASCRDPGRKEGRKTEVGEGARRNRPSVRRREGEKKLTFLRTATSTTRRRLAVAQQEIGFISMEVERALAARSTI